MSWRSLCLFLILALSSSASALPVVAGFGNSITCDSCGDGSYLGLLGDYLDPDPIIDDNGLSADLTGGVLTRLDDWIHGEGVWEPVGPQTADVLILLTGTPDTYQAVGGWKDQEYKPLETVGNIEAIIDLVLTETAIPLILVAPPPVMDPCGTGPYVVPTCDQIDTRLADLADDLALLAIGKDVPFLDLYAAFAADPRFGQHPGPNSLYLNDGLHPRLETGDTLIAELLAPLIIADTVFTPEPSTALLVASGLVALAHRRRGWRKAA